MSEFLHRNSEHSFFHQREGAVSKHGCVHNHKGDKLKELSASTFLLYFSLPERSSKNYLLGLHSIQVHSLSPDLGVVPDPAMCLATK